MSHISWAILVICLLGAGAAFFSIGAMALRTFSSARLHEAFKASDKEAQAESIIENTEKLILSCALYRLVFNLLILLVLLLVFSAAREGPLQIGDYLAVFIISAAVFLLVSVAIPHAWAKYAGELILCKTYRLFMFFAYVAWPILYVLQLHDRLVRRLAGVAQTTPDQRQDQKEEEFLTDLEQQRIEGVVDAEEQEMIENVLQLTDTTAGEILTPRTEVVAIDADSALEAVLATITQAGHSRFPVYEQTIDNIIGLVYAKDLLKEIGKDASTFRLRDKLRQAYFVPESKSLRELLHEFQNQKLHIAVVLDEYGGTAGIVTLEDIIEELVGEITDEYEKAPPKPIKKIDEDTVEVDARTYVDDLNDELELNLPEDEDYDTIGGFVFSHLGYIPKVGTQFEYANLNFHITAAEPRKIKRIRIQKLGTQ